MIQKRVDQSILLLISHVVLTCFLKYSNFIQISKLFHKNFIKKDINSHSIHVEHFKKVKYKNQVKFLSQIVK